MRHMHYKGIRIPVFILSILINALGIDLIIVAGFGSSPISSVPIVISLYSNWTFGQITFFANILFIAAQIALLRRQFHPIEALQLGISVSALPSTCICLFYRCFRAIPGLWQE